MKVRLVWPDYRVPGNTEPVTAFWVECSEGEAREQILPLLSDEDRKKFEERRSLYRMPEGYPAWGDAGSLFFLVSRTLSFAFFEPWQMPYSGLWNAYCPLREIEVREIGFVEEIRQLEEE